MGGGRWKGSGVTGGCTAAAVAAVVVAAALAAAAAAAMGVGGSAARRLTRFCVGTCHGALCAGSSCWYPLMRVRAEAADGASGAAGGGMELLESAPAGAGLRDVIKGDVLGFLSCIARSKAWRSCVRAFWLSMLCCSANTSSLPDGVCISKKGASPRRQNKQLAGLPPCRSLSHRNKKPAR